MLKIKSIVATGLALAAGVLSPVAMAQPTLTGTLSLSQGAYSYDVGGEFTAVTAPSLLAPYLAVTGTPAVQTVGAGQGFQTFCVQTAVEFTPASSPYNNSTPYNYSTSLGSLDYVNGVAGHTDVNPLSVGAAWLYGEFAQGKLAGYDFNLGNTPADATARLADAGLLQAALWALEGGQTYSGYTTTGNVFYNEALSQFGNSLAAADASVISANYSLYDVEVLNLSTGSGSTLNSAQNQLVWLGGGTGYGNSNVPDNSMTFALSFLSLAGLAVFASKVGVPQLARQR